MKHKGYVFLLLFALTGAGREGFAQAGSRQARLGEKLLNGGLDSLDHGLILRGLEGLWYRTGDGRYFKAIQHSIDKLLTKEGEIPSDLADHYYGEIVGRNILLVYKVTNQEKYYKAATDLLGRLKKFSPAFSVEYGALFHEADLFSDATRQLVSHSNAVSLPWYGLELVEALDYFPAAQTGRDSLLALLRIYADAVRKIQDSRTGLWPHDMAGRGAGMNGPDAFASCLSIYNLSKAVRLGYLPASFLSAAKMGYAGILKKFVSASGDFMPNGNKESLADGAFLLAAGEMEMLPDLAFGKGRTVMLDYYFNNEHKKDITGQSVRFHYTWEDQSNSGFSLFGDVFRQLGMHTDSLPFSPDADNLGKASVYIIVDPDDARESPSPNYMSADKARHIFDWVKAGGVLVLMSNDSANAEFEHFEQLPEKFGIHFKWDCFHKVTGNQYEMGAFTMTGKEGIFKTAKKVYIKELSTLKLSPPARPVFSDGNEVIIGVAKLGKGTVLAVGDPWFYNEYFDGRKLPAGFDNFNAAKDLIRWLIAQIPDAGK